MDIVKNTQTEQKEALQKTTNTLYFDTKEVQRRY